MYGCMPTLLGLCIQSSPILMQLQSIPYVQALSPTLQDIDHPGYLAEFLLSNPGP